MAPRDEHEATIAGYMESLLGIPDLSVHDSFFELGGHSLLGTRLLSRVRDELGIELPISALFESPTVAGFARRISGRAAAGRAAEKAEEEGRSSRRCRAAAPSPSPSPRSASGSSISSSPAARPTTSRWRSVSPAPSTRPRSAAALSEVVRRHEALRTTFAALDGSPAQIVAAPTPLRLPRVDLTALPAAGREAEARRLAGEEARRPFDLATGPLLRAAMIDLGDRDRLLLVNMHHIVSDGWSLGIFISEVAALYGAFAAGRPSPLPELPVQYADFAVWQRRRLSGPVLERHLDYWRQRLGGETPVLALPADRPRPAAETFAGGRRWLHLDLDLTRRLNALGRERSATLFMVVLAAFDVLLHRYTGQEDLAVGTPIAGRTRAEVEG